MIVKAIFKDEKHDYFRDVQTKTKRVFGEIFECDDEKAEQRIEKGLVKKATKKEEKEYYDSIETNDNEENNGTESNDKPINIDLNVNVNEKAIINKIQQQNEE